MPFLILFSVSIALFAAHPNAAYAQSAAGNNPYLTPNTETNVPANLHTMAQSLLLESVDALSCGLTGVEFLNKDHNCLGFNPQTGKIGYATRQGGLLPIMGNMISMLYTPALHTSDYVAYLQHNFITHRGVSYAATTNTGLGFQGLTPLLGVWEAFRNIMYLLFTIFFILIGLAIMLRIRLDPKTAVSIQSALPKMVIGLLLVTFSFAIVGFLIDLMYVLSYVVITVMHTADPTGIDPQNILTNLNRTPLGFADIMYHGSNDNWGIFDIVGAITVAVQQVISQTVAELTKTNAFLAFLLGIWNFGCWIGNLNPFAWHPETINWADCAGGFVSTIAYIFIWLTLYFAILSALFRLWWTMIRAYVLILVDTCLAPFYIGLGVLPGADFGFSTWIMGIIAHLALFPASIFMFLLAKIFIDKLVVTGVGGNGDFFMPPLLGNLFSPTADRQISYIGFVAAFGVIQIMPTLLDQIRERLHVQVNKHVGSALTAGVTAGAAGAGIVVGRTWSTLTRQENSKQGIQEGLGRKLALGGITSRRRAAFNAIKGRLGFGNTDTRNKNK